MHSSQQSRSKVGATAATIGPADNFSKQYLVNGWSHGVSINQNAGVGDSGTGISSHDAEPPVFKGTNSLVAAPKSSSLGKERLPETRSSFHLSEPGTTTTPSGLQFTSIGKHNDEENLRGKKRKNSTQCGASINPHSRVSSKNIEDEQRRDASPLIVNNLTGENERKLKNELNPPGASSGPTAKLASESSQEDNATKGDSFHSRAKRGQATNRHSLAERLRRERINERMRLLQDLVPGCNKVAGKAVMLDEIINYVQSLQCQVEFLAMKLATVSPGLNVDQEQILLKNVMLRSIPTSLPGVSSYNAVQSDTMRCVLDRPSDVAIDAVPRVSGRAQLTSGWDEELLNITQMNYVLDQVVHGTKGMMHRSNASSAAAAALVWKNAFGVRQETSPTAVFGSCHHSVQWELKADPIIPNCVHDIGEEKSIWDFEKIH